MLPFLKYLLCNIGNHRIIKDNILMWTCNTSAIFFNNML